MHKIKWNQSPEFKAQQSARMKEFWKRRHAATEQAEREGRKLGAFLAQRHKAQQLRGTLKYVSDDEITAKVEILRKLMDKGELASWLSTKAHEIINESNGQERKKE